MSTLNNNYFQSMLMVVMGAVIAIASSHFGNNQDIAAAGIGLMMVGMRHMESTDGAGKGASLPAPVVVEGQQVSTGLPPQEQHESPPIARQVQ